MHGFVVEVVLDEVVLDDVELDVELDDELDEDELEDGYGSVGPGTLLDVEELEVLDELEVDELEVDEVGRPQIAKRSTVAVTVVEKLSCGQYTPIFKVRRPDASLGMVVVALVVALLASGFAYPVTV